MKRNIYTALLLLFISLSLNGQVVYNSSNIGFLSLSENAAYSGSRDNLNITTDYRNQRYGGLNSDEFNVASGDISGGSKTIHLNVHTPLNNTKFAIGGAFTKTSQPTLKSGTYMLTGSYKIDLTEKANVRCGLGLGASSVSLDASQLRFYNSTEPLSISMSRMSPTINLGLLYQRKNTLLSISLPNILVKSSTVNGLDSEQINSNSQFQYQILYAHKFNLSENYGLQTNVKYLGGTQNHFSSLETTLLFTLQERLWIGGIVRSGSLWVGLTAGVNLMEGLGISYSYEKLTNELDGTANEILLRYELNKNKRFSSLLF